MWMHAHMKRDGDIFEERRILEMKLVVADEDKRDELAFQLIDMLNITNYKRILSVLKTIYQKNEELTQYITQEIESYLYGDDNMREMRKSLKQMIWNKAVTFEIEWNSNRVDTALNN